MAHWNAASLFGGLRSIGQRQTKKRQYLADVLEQDEVVGVETRGTASDLEQLPRSHRYLGTFFPETSPGTSGSGGMLVAICNELVDRAARAIVQVHARGRAFTSFCEGELYDGALGSCSSQRLMRSTSADLHRTSRLKIVSGDGSSTIPCEERMSGIGVM